MLGEHAAAAGLLDRAVHSHALGATAALELCATAMALFTGIVRPTANFTERPRCDLDHVPNTARQEPLRAAISSSFAFGGLNAVVALRRFEEWEKTKRREGVARECFRWRGRRGSNPRPRAMNRVQVTGFQKNRTALCGSRPSAAI